MEVVDVVEGESTTAEKVVIRSRDSLRREGVKRSSLRRDQLTGEKRGRSGSMLQGYEAKYPVSGRVGSAEAEFSTYCSR